MLVNQIAVFLENKFGRLHSLTKTLSESCVDILSMNIADTSDFGIVRMITSDNEKAAAALKSAGFTVKSTNLVGVKVENVPGGLSNILSWLSEEGIELEYLYSFVHSDDKKALILFKTSDTEKTLATLSKHNMN